jgi:VanZ family protein
MPAVRVRSADHLVLDRVLLPILASVLLVLGAPYVGELRALLQSSFPDHYRSIIAGFVALGAASAVILTVLLVRRRGDSAGAGRGTRWRYGSMVSALVIAGVYGRAVSTGNTDVDLVEAFHFVEYGLIAYLFYRACRRRGDVSALVLPACAGVLVGVADEWMQWVVPGRVGELHDVLLNAVAIGCGLLLSVAIHPPASLALPYGRASRLALAGMLGGLILAIAGFVDRVHVGHEIVDAQAGVFRSRYDAVALRAAAAERGTVWQASPPPQGGFAMEDHYLSEGLWHVQHRNSADGGRDSSTAWHENLILERYYSPVLDRGSRWSAGQRTEMERRFQDAAPNTYVSTAQPYPIYTIRRGPLWAIAGILVTVVASLLLGGRHGTRTRQAA